MATYDGRLTRRLAEMSRFYAATGDGLSGDNLDGVSKETLAAVQNVAQLTGPLPGGQRCSEPTWKGVPQSPSVGAGCRQIRRADPPKRWIPGYRLRRLLALHRSSRRTCG